eukprot:scaffold71290_cov19-Prasinocladus_malaysianus.AAC.1
MDVRVASRTRSRCNVVLWGRVAGAHYSRESYSPDHHACIGHTSDTLQGQVLHLCSAMYDVRSKEARASGRPDNYESMELGRRLYACDS